MSRIRYTAFLLVNYNSRIFFMTNKSWVLYNWLHRSSAMLNNNYVHYYCIFMIGFLAGVTFLKTAENIYVRVCMYRKMSFTRLPIFTFLSSHGDSTVSFLIMALVDDRSVKMLILPFLTNSHKM